ncbi:phosphatase PAP2 family protein [Muricomes intestini]|uniref:phosphatase PAP2 family protein n=1 Tax=Muricomes intestini TaxID=1796634 RepID=UPI002FE3B65D
MKKLHHFLIQHKHFYLLILLIPIHLWFEYSEQYLTPQYITTIPFDKQIPFVPIFVVPYVLWFAFVPFGVIYVGIHSKEDYCKLFIFLFGGMVIANIIFTVFPNAQDLRPDIGSSDPFSMLVKFIYTVDTPTDVCPSIHVINSIAVNAALQHSQSFSVKQLRKLTAHILTILICLSTMFIKQHAVIDVGIGIIISAVFYISLYILPTHHIKSCHLDQKEKAIDWKSNGIAIGGK